MKHFEVLNNYGHISGTGLHYSTPISKIFRVMNSALVTKVSVRK